MNEIWKDIPEYEGVYQVSNLGRVKSLNRYVTRNGNSMFVSGKIFKPYTDKYGYSIIVLCNKGKQKTKKVHQLVAITFLNHNPCGHKLVIDHINDIKTDNRVENLQVVTNRFNCCKTQGNGTSKYKGVCWVKNKNKWKSQISINKKTIHLGYFNDEYEAYLCYEKKVKEIERGNSIIQCSFGLGKILNRVKYGTN